MRKRDKIFHHVDCLFIRSNEKFIRQKQICMNEIDVKQTVRILPYPFNIVEIMVPTPLIRFEWRR